MRPATKVIKGKQRSLEVREDVAFERRLWRVQRVGWVAITLVLLAGLAGLFGNGPLSHVTASAGNLQVRYDRFVHADAPTTLDVDVSNVPGNVVRLAIDRSLLEPMDVQRMQPRPERTRAAGDAVVFEFDLSDARTLHVLIDASPQSPALASGSIAVLESGAAATVPVRQLIYP